MCQHDLCLVSQHFLWHNHPNIKRLYLSIDIKVLINEWNGVQYLCHGIKQAMSYHTMEFYVTTIMASLYQTYNS